MKCQDIEKTIMAYVDNEVPEELQSAIKAHLQECPSCRQWVHILEDEVEAIQAAMTLPPLPDTFEEDVVRHLESIAATKETSAPLPPRKMRHRHKRRNRQKLVLASISSILALMLIGTAVSPTLASYVSSFLTRIGGDLGLKKAAELGFSTPVNAAVTDQGITLKIKDIIADPTRLVVSYVLLDDQGKVLPDLYFETYGSNQVYVTDESGEKIAEKARFQLGDQYADLTFSLQNPPNHIIVHLNIQEYGSREVKPIQWSLQVPVDIEKSMAASKTVPIQQSYTTPQGLALYAKQVTYAPSATRLEIETQWTGEAKERIQKQARKRLQMDPDEAFLRDLLSHKISYHIEDEQGQIYADMVPGSVNQTKTVSLAEYTVENDADKQGWYGSFVPYEEKGKLFLVLDEIMVNEPADISLSFDPKKLSRQPFRQQIGDNAYTLSSLVQETVEGTGEKVWKMELDIVGTTTSWPKWYLRDDKGRFYPVAIDYQRSPIEGSSAGAHVKETLLIKQLDQLPSQLTLLMQTQKKTYDNFQWRVEIPPAP
ncbi:DUF4179 domain-containing protein [Brevibacillus panacihumi]|uniref:DUF4179 domain-containing protein n=1 Tax=Brevibacillus panacihumi TaxID=497735 RepID=UPI003D1CBA62